jgi:hypothetical protein
MALLSLLGLTTTAVGANAAPTRVGAGFTVTTADLACILKQIKIGEGRSPSEQRGGRRVPTRTRRAAS